MRRPRPLGALAAALVLLAAAAVGALLWRGQTVPALAEPAHPAPVTADQRAQGAVLVRAAHCLACHSQPGQPDFSGGRPVHTPFGTVTPGNLTPDPETGLGRWTEAAFTRALRHGVSADGRLLYPAFPYPAFSQLSDEDVHAIWAHLRSLPPVQRATPAPALDWPANQPWALAIWRGLFFHPAPFKPVAAASAAWNRGAYLAAAVSHCGACHDARNALGAPRSAGALDGESLPGSGWHAPSLHRADEAGVQDWPEDEVLALLRTGQAPRGRANGPMAEVVVHGTQHLPEADLRALATWLRSLPRDERPAPAAAPAPAERLAAGREVYTRHCAECHGERGEGVAGVYPPLAGNRLLAQARPDNLARVVLEGGFEPATAAHPRPFGMPPFGPLLGDQALADLLSALRADWGGGAGAVSTVEINRLRGAAAR